MRAIFLPILGIALFINTPPLHAEEKPARSRIIAVGLFKNGVVVVKREAMLGPSGTYVLDDVPQPIHGTYWVESAAPVETAVQMREVEVPANQFVPGDLQEDLAGRKVTIHFKGGKNPPTSGTVAKLKPAKGEEGRSAPTYAAAGTPSRFLVLQTAKGRTYLDASEIASVEAEGTEEKIKRRMPRLVLAVGKTDKTENRVAISYLTRGLSWAPSYRIDISDPRTLKLEQQTVIKNELADIEDAEIKLISGFPSVQFAHVTSPLSSRTSWAAFFQELSNRGWRDADVASNVVMTQQIAGNRYVAPSSVSMSAIPTGDGVDLHYQSIGKRTLAEGDSMALTTAQGKANYERIVEWCVPERGRPEEDADDTAWDALRFKNPFTFAMTTGPAMVVAGEKFNGQRTSFWVNAGEETMLRVNKALSVRTRAIENEEARTGQEQGLGRPRDPREIVWIGGRAFRKSTVEGELAVSNHRQETIQMVIRKRFSGDLLKADGSPKVSLREEGVHLVNRRNELLWTMPLKPGEEKRLKYSYTVLTSN